MSRAELFLSRETASGISNESNLDKSTLFCIALLLPIFTWNSRPELIPKWLTWSDGPIFGKTFFCVDDVYTALNFKHSQIPPTFVLKMCRKSKFHLRGWCQRPSASVFWYQTCLRVICKPSIILLKVLPPFGNEFWTKKKSVHHFFPYGVRTY